MGKRVCGHQQPVVAMQAVAAMARDEDEVLLAEIDATQQPSGRRLWPWVGGALLLVAGGGVGSKAMLSSSTDDVTSLHSHHHHYHSYPAWMDQPERYDAAGCTWDGDDCSDSRCCAKPGSRCFVKSRHWSSCNETCHSNVKWEAGRDNRGHWTVTNYHVWECRDITVARSLPSSAPVTTLAPAPVAVAPATTPAPTSPPAQFHYWDDNLKKMLPYPKPGEESAPPSTASPASTTAGVRWHA